MRRPSAPDRGGRRSAHCRRGRPRTRPSTCAARASTARAGSASRLAAVHAAGAVREPDDQARLVLDDAVLLLLQPAELVVDENGVALGEVGLDALALAAGRVVGRGDAWRLRRCRCSWMRPWGGAVRRRGTRCSMSRWPRGKEDRRSRFARRDDAMLREHEHRVEQGWNRRRQRPCPGRGTGRSRSTLVELGFRPTGVLRAEGEALNGVVP
jgi:hypothetical protein